MERETSGLRAFLTLSRASLLPTVWSNCLAGWWLGGAGREEMLGFLLSGATCLYVGGAFLNDAFDAEFDRQFRRTRPVPSGAVSVRAVWGWGVVWVALGMAALFWVGRTTGVLGCVMAAWLMVFNGTHRLVTFSPILLGFSRFLLYITAASMALDGVRGWAIWCGVAQALYVAGAGFPLRRENPAEPMRYWPMVLLAAPIVLASVLNNGEYREPGLLLTAVVFLWVLRAVRYSLWSVEPNRETTAAALGAGIVLVDWLAVVDAPRLLSVGFIALFLLTLLFQRLARPGKR